MIKRSDFKMRVVIIVVLVIWSTLYILPLSEKINLGLDLKGGMYLILKADVPKMPKKAVTERKKLDEELLDKLIEEDIVGEVKKDDKYIVWNVFSEETLKAKLTEAQIPNSTNILDIWRKSSEEGVAEAIRIAKEVISSRINEFGVKEPDIRIQGTDTLLVQLPGQVDRSRALKVIKQIGYNILLEEGKTIFVALFSIKEAI